MIDLHDKVAIITGSSRGIGAAIALTMSRLGAKVVINHRNSAEAAEALQTTIQQHKGEAIVLQADVSVEAEAGQLLKDAMQHFGRIDILVNNAGVTRDNLLMRMKTDDWTQVLQTNLQSCFYCSKAVLRPMMRQKWGRIINITSVVGLAGQAGQTNYAAAKAGLIGFTKSLAKEVGSRGITVNAVAPGFVPTTMTEDLPEDMIKQIVDNTPLGRMGSPEDIAAAVAFLASEQASFITGQVLSVDGGLIMQ